MSKPTDPSTFSRRGLALIIALAAAVLLLTMATVIPEWRHRMKDFWIPGGRQILAKTTGLLTPEGPFVTVFKIREKEDLFVEVYQTASNDPSSQELLAKLSLPEGRDGYFSFQGNATNLVLSDMDRDGALDVIAPTFDEQMTARLHVFRFNRVTKSFERLSAPVTGNE